MEPIAHLHKSSSQPATAGDPAPRCWAASQPAPPAAPCAGPAARSSCSMSFGLDDANVPPRHACGGTGTGDAAAAKPDTDAPASKAMGPAGGATGAVGSSGGAATPRHARSTTSSTGSNSGCDSELTAVSQEWWEVACPFPHWHVPPGDHAPSLRPGWVRTGGVAGISCSGGGYAAPFYRHSSPPQDSGGGGGDVAAAATAPWRLWGCSAAASSLPCSRGHSNDGTCPLCPAALAAGHGACPPASAPLPLPQYLMPRCRYSPYGRPRIPYPMAAAAPGAVPAPMGCPQWPRMSVYAPPPPPLPPAAWFAPPAPFPPPPPAPAPAPTSTFGFHAYGERAAWPRAIGKALAACEACVEGNTEACGSCGGGGGGGARPRSDVSSFPLPQSKLDAPYSYPPAGASRGNCGGFNGCDGRGGGGGGGGRGSLGGGGGDGSGVGVGAPGGTDAGRPSATAPLGFRDAADASAGPQTEAARLVAAGGGGGSGGAGVNPGGASTSSQPNQTRPLPSRNIKDAAPALQQPAAAAAGLPAVADSQAPASAAPRLPRSLPLLRTSSLPLPPRPPPPLQQPPPPSLAPSWHCCAPCDCMYDHGYEYEYEYEHDYGVEYGSEYEPVRHGGMLRHAAAAAIATPAAANPAASAAELGVAAGCAADAFHWQPAPVPYRPMPVRFAGYGHPLWPRYPKHPYMYGHRHVQYGHARPAAAALGT